MNEQAAQRSRELFESGYYCAESVLLAIAEGQGLQSNSLPRIATGFCSGLARTCGMCGAVSGAIMGLGLVTGRTAPTEPVTQNYALVRKLLDTFDARFGTTNCQALLGCDLGTAEGQQMFRANKLANNASALLKKQPKLQCRSSLMRILKSHEQD